MAITLNGTISCTQLVNKMKSCIEIEYKLNLF